MASASAHPSTPKESVMYYPLTNYRSDLCLGIKGGGTGNELAIQWTCNGRYDQGWGFPESGGYYHMENLNGRCLGIQGGSKAQGAHAIQWRCENVANQEWKAHIVINDPASPIYELQNRGSGRCLTVSGGSTRPGAYVIQWSCVHNSDQWWFLTVPLP
jgi:hypothetical protein